MAEKKEIKTLLGSYYKIEDNKVIRLKKQCPKCGRYMAEHKDRYHCGYCGYTEFKQQVNKVRLDNIGIYL